MIDDNRPEWGLVAVTEDLGRTARELSQLAWEYRQEARLWTHPAGRRLLEEGGATLTTWAQSAALETGRGDYHTRYEALMLAMARIDAASLSLRLWKRRGDLWNAHRIRPERATIEGRIER